MRFLFSLLILFIAQAAFCQTKEELIASVPLDSVIVYQGEGFLSTGNCLILKYSGDPQVFFNELAAFHTHEEGQIDRTEVTINMYNVNKPYWVYGNYSVHAGMASKSDHTLIQIHFQAYNNPGNYKMHNEIKHIKKS
jgi:hypothetical protein